MNITLMVISIYILLKHIVALYRGVPFFSHVRMDPTLPGFNQYCRELMCLAQGHNKVTHVGIEARTSLFGVPHSTTTPSRKHVRAMYTPLNPTFIYSKTGVCRGIPIFLNFASNHRLWVLVRNASPRRF